MKRLFALLLALVTVISLYSCAKEDSERIDAESKADTTAESNEEVKDVHGELAEKAEDELPDIILEAIRAYHGVEVGGELTDGMIESVETITIESIGVKDDKQVIDAAINGSDFYAICIGKGYIRVDRFEKSYSGALEDISDRFEADPGLVINGMNANDFDFMMSKFMAYYEYKNPEGPGLTEEAKQSILTFFPITKEVGAIVVSEPDLIEREKEMLVDCFEMFYPIDHFVGEDGLDLSSLDLLPNLEKVSYEHILDVRNCPVTAEPLRSDSIIGYYRCGDKLEWRIENDSLIISGNGDMWDFNDKNGDRVMDVPWARNDFDKVVIEEGVTSVGNGAFEYNDGIESVELPVSLHTIGNRAFSECNDLEEINLPENLVYIKDRAFANCRALEEIVFPDSLWEIGEAAFMNCSSIENIELPNSLGRLEALVFSGCEDLEEVTIGPKVTEFEKNVFSGCTSLENIFVDEDNDAYSSIDGVVFSKYGTNLLLYPNGKSQRTYRLPDSTRNITEDAFFNNDTITELVVPAGVLDLTVVDLSTVSALERITVDDKNIAYCDVDGVLYTKDMTELIKVPASWHGDSYTVPDETVTLFDLAFDGCDGLKEIVVHEKVDLRGLKCFENVTEVETIIYEGSVDLWRALGVITWVDVVCSDGIAESIY